VVLAPQALVAAVVEGAEPQGWCRFCRSHSGRWRKQAL